MRMIGQKSSEKMKKIKPEENKQPQTQPDSAKKNKHEELKASLKRLSIEEIPEMNEND